MDPSSDVNQRTLWVGDLAYWVDENYIQSWLGHNPDLTSVKVIRNKSTGLSEGYGFLEFRTHEAADRVLKLFNGQLIPNTDQTFRLNWATSVGTLGKGPTEDYSIFVGDLAPDVTDYVLQEQFRQYFPSVRSAKVITDTVTQRSKGYGFVRFGSEQERDRALHEMNGQYIYSRPIRVSIATAKKNPPSAPGSTSSTASHPSDFDPQNTTLFIGGLSSGVSEEQLRSIFGRFGDIVYVKIPQGKGCGFVQFVQRKDAEMAMAEMNGIVIGSSAIRISWGRSSAKGGPPPPGGAPIIPMSPYGYPPYPLYGYEGAYGYGPYDPYAFYGMDPATYAAYAAHAASYAMVGGMPPAAVAAHQAALAAQAAAMASRYYDPMSPVNVEKINAGFVQRHKPRLTGSFLKTTQPSTTQ